MDTYEECLYCQEIASISDKKKCITDYDGFWEIYLNNDVLEISMYDFVDRHQDPLITIVLNQYMNHDCKIKPMWQRTL